jgi:L1 cell adhesion molecule like protein
MKNSINDEKIAGQLSGEDKDAIKKAVDDTIKWLDSNQTAEKDEYEHKREELEKLCMPIMTKLYQQGGGQMPDFSNMGGFPTDQTQAPTSGKSTSGPKIEEVD